MRSFSNAIVRALFRVFFPGVAKNMEDEGQFDFRNKENGRCLDASLYIDVEDNGSDVTVICFAGMAVLYSAMPKFEFRKTLLSAGGKYNFIWVRDIHRSMYDLAPDGSGSGYGFYARLISDALSQLNSSRVVAIGASGGAAAAFGLSGRLPIQLIVAFNPAFPLSEYGSGKNVLRSFCSFRKLFTSPGDYLEVSFLTLGARYLLARCRRLLGEGGITDVLMEYRSKQPPALATVFYSERCLPDLEQIRQLKGISSITLKPVDSGRHNCMGELKRRGEFGALIQEEIRAGLNAIAEGR
jgi:hypothetical protein